jgi:NTE family protein
VNAFRRFDEVGSALLGLGFFVGGTLEYGAFYNDSPSLADEQGLFGGSTYLGVDTPILPLYVGLGFAEEGEHSFYLAMGRIAAR